MTKQATKPAPKIVCQNRKARHEYHIEETLEAGIELKGTEVKSLRQGKGSLQEAYARIKGDEAWLCQFHISPYEQGNRYNVDPVRERKLLLHKREVGRLAGLLARKGYTLIPLQVYFKRGWAKVLLGLARGKRQYDKRQDLKRRDQERELRRAASVKR